MKPAMALLRQEQKDGHSRLFHRMYSFQITQDEEEAGGREDERKRGTERGMIELVMRGGQSCDLFLNFEFSSVVVCVCVCVGN